MARDGAPQGYPPFYPILCLFLLFAPLGCAHRLPSPLAEPTKAQLGTIGVVSTQSTPKVDYQTPARGGAAGAAIGAAKGLGIGALGAAGCFLTYGWFITACGVAIGTPVFAVVLAVDQAKGGVSADAIEAAETAIKAVLAEQNRQAMARDDLFRMAAAHTNQRLVLVSDQAPIKPSEPSHYRHLADQGIDTVLEITVQQIALRHPPPPPPRLTLRHHGIAGDGDLSIIGTGYKPALLLVVTTRRRVVRTADGTILYDYTGDHSGRTATFTDWGANDAQLLRDGLAQLSREIAGEIVSQVFGVPVPPADELAAPVHSGPSKGRDTQRDGSCDGAESPCP